MSEQPSFIDSHAHLADPAFDVDRGEVLRRARVAGARALVCIGESLQAADRARALAADHPGFVAWTAGVHPHDAASFDAARDVPAIRKRLLNGACAVGECGLDYHYDHSPRDAQLAALHAQLALARECSVPVVLHTREAERDSMEMLALAKRTGVRGVMHCFTGSRELASAALEADWYISFSGIITFRRWTDVELLRFVPEERLLVESDSPYLAPVPNRGKRNEPAWVASTLAVLADRRGVNVYPLGERITNNARTLFGLASDASPKVDSTASTARHLTHEAE